MSISESGGVEDEGRDQEGENKFRVNQSPGCNFLSVLKMGISQAWSQSLTYHLLLYHGKQHNNNGCAVHNRKDSMVFGNRKFLEGTVGSVLFVARY